MRSTEITLDKTYTLVSDYKDDVALRESFNSLTDSVFGFNLEQWYQNGYWGENYICYSLTDQGRVVANVSVNLIDFFVEEQKRCCLQIGTVMTALDYRKKGLSKYILEQILQEYDNKCDLIYLFANAGVIDYYPKFGFVPVQEYQYSKNLSVGTLTPNIIKLNMANKSQREFVVNYIQKAQPYSALAMQGNASLVMFHCTTSMYHHVYFLQELDAVVIADLDDEIMYLNAVYASKPISLEHVIRALANVSMTKVVLGFTPHDTGSYECSPLKNSDTLFVRGDSHNIMSDKKYMFPQMSHA